jgi:signal transduction histidine kinase
MSLRFRLVALIVALVALVAVALSGFELDALLELLSGEALERSQLASQQLYASLIEHMNPGAVSSADAAETQAQWTLVSSPDIAKILLDTLARWPSVVEINVAGANGQILASSTDTRIGTDMRHLESFPAWRVKPLRRRVGDLIGRLPDLEVTVNIGPAGESHPLFTIQVVSSTVLLRDALQPQALRLVKESAAAVLASLLLTLLFSNLILGPLRRIEQTIDRIVQGSAEGGAEARVEDASARTHARHGAAKEFRVVENKLSLLGQQYQGAREDVRKLRNRIDIEVERIASQLDVAARVAAISRLSGGVAHEIKNPLNAIILRLDLMRERWGGPEEELASEIGILSKEVLRLDRVVKTFLDFTRPVEVRFQELDLTAVAREVAVLMTPQARHSGIEIQFHAPAMASSGVTAGSAAPGSLSVTGLSAASSAAGPGAAGLSATGPLGASGTFGTAEPLGAPGTGVASPILAPIWMRGDPDLLKQAILNLVTNAMEAMKTGGQLRMTVAPEGGNVTLEVADTGPGIPPEVQAKVFQLYFTTKEKGSGIGLAMTNRATQLHNGTIEFTSEPGRGTVFLLRFPALPGAVGRA